MEEFIKNIIEASLPNTPLTEPFIDNDRPIYAPALEQSIVYAQKNYCGLSEESDNIPQRKREKAISAYSYQGGYRDVVNQKDKRIKELENILQEIADEDESAYKGYTKGQLVLMAKEILNKK